MNWPPTISVLENVSLDYRRWGQTKGFQKKARWILLKARNMHKELALTKVNGSPSKTGTADEGSWVVFTNNLGLETRATMLRLTQHAVVFEIYSPATVLRMSQILEDFKLYIGEAVAYAGRAIVSNVVSTGAVLVAEVTLGEAWVNTEILA